MRPSLIHRFLGIAGIVALLNAHSRKLDFYGRRLARQERLMTDVSSLQQSADQKVEQLSQKVAIVATGVTGIRADLDALKNAHNDPDDKTTLSAAGLAALDGALAKVDALADSFAAPSVPSEPETSTETGDAGTSETEPTSAPDESSAPTQPTEPTEPATTGDGSTSEPLS